MNLKRLMLIFLALLTFVLCVGMISAADCDIEPMESQSSLDYNVISAESQTEDADSNFDNPPVTTSKVKVKTKVEAPPVALKYKKNNYFKVKIENKKDDDIPVKKVKVNLKIYTGSKSKTYIVKTNSNGKIKFNTKNLKKGVHKVVISSADEKYSISKTTKIYIGKECKVTLKENSKKVLKNKDVIRVKVVNDDEDNEKEANVIFKKSPKFTKITKAKFYLKNKKTGKIIVETDKVEFENGRWEIPDEDYSTKYQLVKVKVYFINYK